MCHSETHINFSLYGKKRQYTALDRMKSQRFKQSLLAGTVFAMLTVFASAVEAFVEEAEPLLQVMSVQSHHSVSHHPLLSN